MCRAVLALENVGLTINNKHNLKERYNVDNTKTITHLSLCSGYEGIGLGLRRVLPNLREIAYVEREGFPVANLVAKMEAGELDAAPVYTDVKTFPYGEFRGCVDILSGGFPCQPFSAAGKRNGVEDPRHLFPYIAAGIRECQPRIVFLENVEGIISAKTADGESVLQYVLRELEGLGYRATAGVFSAAEVGAPHQRKRVFIIGLAYSIGAGLEGHGWYEQGEGRQSTGKGRSVTKGCLPSRWPSRPSEPQHEWEEPRVTAVADSKHERSVQSKHSSRSREGVSENGSFNEQKKVADTKSQQSSSSNHRGESGATGEQEEGELGRGDSGSLRQVTGQAESRLGRASNGSSSRVDRLRLLGNGVVPATAAKAFVTLIQRLND